MRVRQKAILVDPLTLNSQSHLAISVVKNKMQQTRFVARKCSTASGSQNFFCPNQSFLLFPSSPVTSPWTCGPAAMPSVFFGTDSPSSIWGLATS